MVTASWRTKSFSVDAHKILSFNSMTLSTGVELEEKITGNTAYQEKSSESPSELSIDVHISSLLGNNAGAELESWIRLSRDGVAGRFYVGRRDFLGCTLILTQCEAKDIQLAPNGELKSCNLSLTFEQASGRWTSESAQEEMLGGGGGGGGGGGKKINKLSDAARAAAKAKNASKRDKEKDTLKKLNTIKSSVAKVKKDTKDKGKEASKTSVVTKTNTKPNTINATRKTTSVKPKAPPKPTPNKVNKATPTKGLTNVFRKTNNRK